MIETVLATDMAVHFDLLNRFKAEIGTQPDLSEWKDRTLLYQMLVHLADIANPSRPFHLARGWAERVIEEFCEQVRCLLAQGFLRGGGVAAGWRSGVCLAHNAVPPTNMAWILPLRGGPCRCFEMPCS